MSKNTLRKDKTCLNCRHVVENRYCPNCGQENSDTRKTFHHLFIHFFEDLTHYENAFWRTIKNLLFKPAALTKEYLSGKRLSYLAPIRLYIFISFITFFIITILAPKPEFKMNKNINEKLKTEMLKEIPKYKLNKSESDSVKLILEKMQIEKSSIEINGLKSIKQLDSIQKYGSEKQKMGNFMYWITKKGLKVKEENSTEEVLKKFIESFQHNFSKVLFIYMPLFAFFLWIFHDKKRWYYFDHGIFTIHYFSFLLLISLLLILINKFFDAIGDSEIIDVVTNIINVVGVGWMFYYFFPAHHRFYSESHRKSLFKSLILLFINIFLIIIILTLFALYTFLTIE